MNRPSPINRREFLATSTLTAAGLAAASLAAPRIVRAAAPQPNTYKLAIAGSGWWGKNILREAIMSKACKVVGVCDVDPAMRKEGVAMAKEMAGDEPKEYEDFREMLAKEKPDILINGTPDHWHPLITIEAVKAGAHVYVEKPISHTIKEGRAMVNAARHANRVVQVGTHRRVSPHNVSGREFVRSGKAGKIGAVKCFVNYGGGGPERPEANSEPPPGLNWDMWCGPGPLRPFNKRLHPKGFRGFLDYANGTLGDWGIHWTDQALWILDRPYPTKVFSSGGRTLKGPPVNNGDGQTTDAPDHQYSTWEFDDALTVTWEHRQFGANNQERTHAQQPVGCYFYGTNGVFHQGWMDGWTFYPSDGRRKPEHQDAQLNKPDDQNIKELWADFLKCIKSGEKPVSDIEAIHRSTSMALLGMLSLKLGRSIQWDGQKEICVDAKGTPDEEANKLLKREYRKPWVYPEA